MNASTDQLTQRSTAESTVEVRTEPAGTPVSTRAGTTEAASRDLLAITADSGSRAGGETASPTRRAGESEWTPWFAITGLILFFAAIGLLMFRIVEIASHLLASASSEG